jgi:hypothetical protein
MISEDAALADAFEYIRNSRIGCAAPVVEQKPDAQNFICRSWKCHSILRVTFISESPLAVCWSGSAVLLR